MSAISTPHPAGREFFTAPAEVNQRRYEALRAYHVEDLTLAAAGQRFGYTRATMASLVRDFRAGRLKLFTPPGKPGRSSAPATDRARGRVVELRRQGLSVHEISSKLADEGTPSTAPASGRSSPRKASDGCCAVPPGSPASTPPPPAATPACPAWPPSTSPTPPTPPPRAWPACCFCCPTCCSPSTCPAWSPPPATQAPEPCPPSAGSARCWP